MLHFPQMIRLQEGVVPARDYQVDYEYHSPGDKGVKGGLTGSPLSSQERILPSRLGALRDDPRIW